PRQKTTDGFPRSPMPDSFGALLADYFADPVFQDKASSTKKIYRLILEPIGEKYGALPAAQLGRKQIKEGLGRAREPAAWPTCSSRCCEPCSSTRSKRAIASTIRQPTSPCGSWASTALGWTKSALSSRLIGPLARCDGAPTCWRGTPDNAAVTLPV